MVAFSCYRVVPALLSRVLTVSMFRFLRWLGLFCLWRCDWFCEGLDFVIGFACWLSVLGRFRITWLLVSFSFLLLYIIAGDICLVSFPINALLFKACVSIRLASSLSEVLWHLCHFGFVCLFCFVLLWYVFALACWFFVFSAASPRCWLGALFRLV